MQNALTTIINGMKNNIKSLLESLMIAERNEYLKENTETKGNGFYDRVLKTQSGLIEDLKIPRTRDGKFRSNLLPKRQHDEAIELLVTELFIEGVSTRKIEGILNKCYHTKLSHTSIANIAKAGEEEISKWTNRRLKSHYACVFIDAFYFPIKRKTVAKEAVFVASAICPLGRREILGYWIPGGCESSSNWKEILNELCIRGVREIDFIIADGLTGIDNAISQVFPRAKYQYCVIHAVRSTLNKARASDKVEVSEDLKRIYKAKNKNDAKENLFEFIYKWRKKYPKICKFWEINFERLTEFMILPRELWRYVYTTNCLERLHKEIKRRLKAMEQFHSEGSAEWILYKLYERQNEKYLCGINHWKMLYADFMNIREYGN